MDKVTSLMIKPTDRKRLHAIQAAIRSELGLRTLTMPDAVSYMVDALEKKYRLAK